MNNKLENTQDIEFTTDIIEIEGVVFNSESLTLRGAYQDELSVFRAKRHWIEALETQFLLSKDYDFTIIQDSFPELGMFFLECQFKTACAKYAFWKLTNNQAPEVQYIIETAHIPICESRHDEIISAPDLKSVHEDSMLLQNGLDTTYESKKNVNVYEWIKNISKSL